MCVETTKGDSKCLFSTRLRSSSPALEVLIQTISQRVGAFLEREGLLVRDIENTYLQLQAADDSANSDLLGHSITYRIAVGHQAGRKAFTLQTVPAREQENDNPSLAKTAGSPCAPGSRQGPPTAQARATVPVYRPPGRGH